MQTSSKNYGFVKTLKNIYNNGGFARFWKGWFLIGSASVPAHSLYFSVYEFMKVKLGVDKSVKLNLLKGFPIYSIWFNGSMCNFIS
jgi:Mitochondrial carrier protein